MKRKSPLYKLIEDELLGGTSFERFKKELEGKPLAHALAMADSVLLDYYDFKAKKNKDIIPIFGCFNEKDYKKLESWLLDTIYELIKERTGLTDIFGDEIRRDYLKLRNKLVVFFRKKMALPEIRRIQLFKKVIKGIGGDPLIVDEISSFLLTGSSLFLLELYIRLIELGLSSHPDELIRKFQQEIINRGDNDLDRFLSKPVLLTELWDHQKEALNKWFEAGGKGIIEMATATGKTLVGLAAALKIYERKGELDVLVLAHSKAILNQWRREAIEKLGFVGNPDADFRTPLKYDNFEMNFNTLQTVHKNPEKYSTDLLIVDEVHHGAARKFHRALEVSCKWKMGLSATVEGGRRHRLAEYLGQTVYTLTIGEARRRGIIPDFDLYVHETYLDIDNEKEFKTVTAEIASLFGCISEDYEKIKELSNGKFETFKTLSDFIKVFEKAEYEGKSIPDEWRTLRNLILKRRWFIHRYGPKIDKAIEIAMNRGMGKKCMIFAMDIQTCKKIANKLRGSMNVYLVHSGLKDEDIKFTINNFRSCDRGVLIAPKILDEGVDIPDAEVGINVASSKTKLQLVQRIGRILRKRPGKKPEFHHFVVVPQRNCFIRFDDAIRYLDEMAWIQDVALRMGIEIKQYREHDFSDLKRESEKYVMEILENNKSLQIGNFGTIRIRNILNRIDVPVREKLVGMLMEFDGDGITDKDWLHLLTKAAHDCGLNEPPNIPGHWWLLMAGGRNPERLAEIIRSSLSN